jgi:hypothetical protein
MRDAAVLLATAAWIFSPLALLLPIAVRDLRQHARTGGFAPTAQITDKRHAKDGCSVVTAARPSGRIIPARRIGDRSGELAQTRR